MAHPSVDDQKLRELKNIRRILDTISCVVVVCIFVGTCFVCSSLDSAKEEYIESRNILMKTYETVRGEIKTEREELYEILESMQDFDNKILTVRRHRGKYIISVEIEKGENEKPKEKSVKE